MAFTKWLVALVVVALLGFLPVKASAESDLGQFCWNWSPFIDTLRCSVQQGTGAATDMFHLFCRERAAGAYQLSGSGLATSSFPTAGSIHLAVQLGNPSADFGGNDHCMFQATLNSGTLNGPLTVNCTGTATPFNNTGTLVFTACSGTMGEEGATGGPVGGR
jgi:hypothetical protein